MAIASVHVSHEPLNGEWHGQHWDQQEARCSNNFLSSSNPPVPPPSGAAGLLWLVVGLDEPDSVTFNVSVDRPDGDPVLWPGLTHDIETPYIPTDAGNDPFYYSRGLYIASVDGAPGPFKVKVVGLGT